MELVVKCDSMKVVLGWVISGEPQCVSMFACACAYMCVCACMFTRESVVGWDIINMLRGKLLYLFI